MVALAAGRIRDPISASACGSSRGGDASEAGLRPSRPHFIPCSRHEWKWSGRESPWRPRGVRRSARPDGAARRRSGLCQPGHPSQRHGAPAWAQVVLDHAHRLAQCARRPLRAEDEGQRVEELAHGAARAALVTVLHLDDQPIEGGLRLSRGALMGPADVLSLAGEGVATGVGDQLPAGSALTKVAFHARPG